MNKEKLEHPSLCYTGNIITFSTITEKLSDKAKYPKQTCGMTCYICCMSHLIIGTIVYICNCINQTYKCIQTR